jgi:predicted RNA-binding Zn ribbon-like protein
VGEVPPDTARSAVEACFREAIGIARLAVGQGGPGEWVVDVASEPLHVIRFRTALSAEGLLRNADFSRLRQCDACTWLFIDRSKGGRRRWCSMATCGNRTKASRHYRRDQAD